MHNNSHTATGKISLAIVAASFVFPLSLCTGCLKKQRTWLPEALKAPQHDQQDSSAILSSPSFTASSTEICDIIVVGGSTAGIAAAIAAAREFTLESPPAGGKRRKVCLTEPTDWFGGQLTSSGVSAIDFSHHKATQSGKIIDTALASTDLRNLSTVFADWMTQLGPVNNNHIADAATCWVSFRCLQPYSFTLMIEKYIRQFVDNGTLKTFRSAVPKSMIKNGRNITGINIVSRKNKATPRSPEEVRPSKDIKEWYEPTNTANFSKQVTLLSGPQGKLPVVIDASDWGEALVLAGGSYMQGIETSENNPTDTNERCGQAFTYGLALEISGKEEADPAWWPKIARLLPNTNSYSLDDVSGTKFSWNSVWNYRRIEVGTGEPLTGPSNGLKGIAVGDISLQNWTAGNDYSNKYLFLSKNETTAQINNWQGGVDTAAMGEAELRALGWFDFLRKKSPANLRGKIKLSPVMANPLGLGRVPYIRDARRSVGVKDFVLTLNQHLLPGKTFPDTIGLGVYAADVHEMHNQECEGKLPPHIKAIKSGSSAHPAPYYLPLSAHTNRDLDNFLVAGKIISQTFAASSSTRVQPTEFASGTGAGVAAAVMQKRQLTSAALLAQPAIIKEIQHTLTVPDARGKARHTPIYWTITQ